MAEIVLKADATSGVEVEVGQCVGKGDRLGVAADGFGELAAPEAGVVENVTFDGENHVFEIRLSLIGE